MAEERLIVSAFLDEGVKVEGIKALDEQLEVGQAVGFKYWTPRFIHTSGEKNLNFVNLDRLQMTAVIKASEDAGYKIGCIGTGIGKEKLRDVNDGNDKAPYTTAEQSKELMKKAVDAAVKADAPFIRAFSFYGIGGKEPSKFYDEALDRVAANVEICADAGKIYLIELEGNLVAYNADMALRFCKDINNPHLLICPDAANSHVQGFDAVGEYKKVAEAKKLGYIHIKDYTKKCPEAIVINEETLKHFGSVDVGVCGHREILDDLATRLASVNEMLRGLGAPGLIADIEGHMKGGGQFGGFSGPDGLGVATRAFTDMLREVGIQYVMRQYGDVRKKPVPGK